MPGLAFALDPGDLPRLGRWPGMQASRAVPATLTWHDTPDLALTGEGLSLMHRAGTWQLGRVHAPSPAEAPALLAEARQPALLDHAIPTTIAPIARLVGRRRTLRLDEITVQVIEGRFDQGPDTHLCHVLMTGPAAGLHALATALAAEFALSPPPASLAALAVAAHTGTPPAPRALGAPKAQPGTTVSDSLADIAGHLLGVMLHWAPLVPGARTQEPVHQMRVATRRLRSALTIYKSAAPCPELAALNVPLKLCAARLGVARDWDVFLHGTGARLAETFPDDRRCAAMLRAGGRRRRDAYADLHRAFAGPDLRSLVVALGAAVALRSWEAAAEEEALLHQDVEIFAAGVLAKRMKRVRQAGRDLRSLPIPALHELRKDCKRLRYAAEFFTNLFPVKRTRRFLSRLADLQEELGLLNDTAAVSGLMAQLGRLEHSYAAGLVEGFSAAQGGHARHRIEAAWKRFRAADPFWTG